MQRTYFTPQNHTWYAYVTEMAWKYGDNFWDNGCMGVWPRKKLFRDRLGCS
jgi:hypothetical protein